MLLRIRSKSATIVTVLTAGIALGQTPALIHIQDGPFGFYRGEALDHVVEAIGGPSHITSQGQDIFTLDTAPNPDPDFAAYILLVSPTDGVLKIVGGGRTITADASGAATRSAFEHLSTVLSAKYGVPTKASNFIAHNTMWSDTLDFQTSLQKGDRTLQSLSLRPMTKQGSVRSNSEPTVPTTIVVM